MADHLVRAGEQSQPGTAWKTIVKAYLSPEHCDHAECGCPLAALAPELARADATMKAQILSGRWTSRTVQNRSFHVWDRGVLRNALPVSDTSL